MEISLKREYASENGTDFNNILPKMSPLNPQYLTKKQTVFQKIVAFIDKFKGVGGKLQLVISLKYDMSNISIFQMGKLKVELQVDIEPS